MPKKYRNDELIAILNEDEKVYTKPCLNIKGNTKEGIPCIEVLARNISFDDINEYKNDLKKDFTYRRKYKEIDTKSEKGLCRCWCLNKEFDEEVIAEKLGMSLQY